MSNDTQVTWLTQEAHDRLKAELDERVAFFEKNGFQVRAKGAKDAWARVTKEIDMFRGIIDQAGIAKL